MSGIKQYKTLNEIPNLSFEGYIWMSNDVKPKVLNKETFDFKSISTNPFIIEALLFDRGKNVSIHIQHTGEYQITAYNLTEIEQFNYTLEEVNYLPHRLDDAVKKVSFKQLWLPEADENCEGMEVLTLKAIVFCGFNKEKKS